MSLLKELHRLWNFYSSDVSDQEERNLLRARLYNLIGFFLTPILTLLVFETLSPINKLFSLLIFLSFSSQLAISYLAIEWAKKNSDKLLFYSYFLYAGYTLIDAYAKNFSIENTFAYITVVFAIVMVLTTPKRVLYFLLFNLFLSTPLIIFSDDSEIHRPFLWLFFIVFYVLGIVVIRGRHETGQKLIERENFLKALFNQSYDAFLLVNFYSREIVDCNEVAVKLFEVNSKSDIVGKSRDHFKVIPFTKDESVEVKNSLREHKSWSSEEEYVTMGGRKFPANVVITTLEVGKSNYYVVRITDITEKKKSEEKIRQSEAKYRSLFERNLAGVYKVRSSDKELLDCNDAFAKILGYSGKKEIIGENCSLLYNGSSDEGTFHDKILEKGQIVNHESMLHLKNGKDIWVIENTTVVNDIDEEPYVEGTMIDITELKKAQQTLQKTEEDRNLLLNSLNVVVYTVHIKGTEKVIEYISPQVEKVFGYTKEQYNQGTINIVNRYHRDDIELLKSKMSEMREKGKPVTLTYRFNHLQQNEYVWIEESIFPQYDKEGNHIANFGIARDVSKSKRNELDLLQSEERFKQLSEVAIEGILFTENGTAIDCNEQFLQIMGYSSIDEVVGKDLYYFVSEESKDFVKEYISSGGTNNYIGIGKKKDGSNIYLETRGQFIKFGNRQIRASVIIDVNDKIEKEKQLQESEQRFKLLAEASQEGIVIHDKGLIIEVNDLLCKMLGYKKKELIGASTFDLVKEKDKPRIKKNVENAVTKPYQVDILRKDGSSFIGEVQARSIPYQGKDFRVAAIRDITEKIEAEKELNRSRERFKKLVENSPDGLVLHIDDKVVFANDSALKIMGLPSFEDFITSPYTDFIAEKYQSKAKKRMALAASGKQLEFEQTQLKKSDGSLVDVESKPMLIDLEGQEAILVVLHDISERLQLQKEHLRAELAEETNKQLNKEIQERIKVEDKLITTQEYTRSIIESSLDIICATDQNGIITEFNKAAQKAFGYKREEAIGKHVSMLYADNREREKTVKQLFDGRGFYTGEVLNKRKNGEEFISYLAASVLKDKEGKTTGLMGVSRDITEVKKAQDLLQQSEEQYRDLFENATDLIQSVAADGKILFVNDSWKRTLGYSDEELKEKNIFEVIAPRSQDHCRSIFQQMFNGEEFKTIEIILLTKKGKEIIAEGNVSTKFEKGKPISTRGIFRDVTASRKAKTDLVQKEQRLSAIINNTNDLILSIDRKLNIIEFNDAVEKLVKHKYHKDVYPGMSVFETVDPEWVEPFKQIYEKVFNGQEYREVVAEQREGEQRFYETSYNPIRDEKGNITGIAIFSQDITDRKRKEDEIEHTLKEKEVLLKEVHHRVKNNLQVISSILNLQSSYINDDNTLKILYESQNRIKSMSFIHETLYQTKDFANIDFHDYILNLSNNLIHSYQIYDDLVELKLDVDKVLLNLDQAIPCGLIVNELFSNALKYAFKPDQKGSISISLKEDNKELTLIISDTGVGLPKEFDFRNAESLGLQLVNTLVEQIDGTIECETGNKGTRFTIVFKMI